MKTVPLTDLVISDRQRRDYSPAHIKQLKQSILSKGLMHAPLISRKDNKFTLIAGGCRVMSMKELHFDGHQFTYDGLPVPHDHVPYSEISDLTPADLAEAELEENLIRSNLSWEETNDAKLLIHRLRLSQDPSQTLTATAKEIAIQSGKSEQAEKINLVRGMKVAEYRNDPRVKDSKSLSEAYKKILDLETAEWQAELVKRGMAIQTSHSVLQGDCREVMKTLPAGTFDLICCDPPYGIKADDMKKGSGHYYDDSADHALDVCKAIISLGFGLLKPRGNLFMFCDLEHFIALREWGKQHGYSAWRTPVLWRKGQEGLAPWGRLGFQRTYESILYLTKGEKGLKGGGADIKDFKRTSRSSRVHAAEKPVALLQHLISLSCDPGDSILDPTCGSGPILDAATLSKCRATGIELDPSYHSFALARLARGPQEEEGDDETEAEAEIEALEEDLIS
jgi:DNA modification methylase